MGKEFNITCIATNDHDAPMNLTLSWTAPSGIDIITANKHDGLTTTSTLYVSYVTHDHSGVYVCTASNGEQEPLRDQEDEQMPGPMATVAYCGSGCHWCHCGIGTLNLNRKKGSKEISQNWHKRFTSFPYFWHLRSY